jgi:hypothetical protein
LFAHPLADAGFVKVVRLARQQHYLWGLLEIVHADAARLRLNQAFCREVCLNRLLVLVVDPSQVGQLGLTHSRKLLLKRDWVLCGGLAAVPRAPADQQHRPAQHCKCYQRDQLETAHVVQDNHIHYKFLRALMVRRRAALVVRRVVLTRKHFPRHYRHREVTQLHGVKPEHSPIGLVAFLKLALYEPREVAERYE